MLYVLMPHSKRRILFAGLVARMRDERLPQEVMFGDLVGGKDYPRRQENHRIVHLKKDMSVLELNLEGWRMNAQRAGVIPP